MMKAKLKLAKFRFIGMWFFSSIHLKMFRPVKGSLAESIISEHQWFNIH